MNTRIKLNKRKMQLLHGAVQGWQNSGSYLAQKYSGECDDLRLRLWSMHVCAPWNKEAKVRFTSDETKALECAVSFKLGCTPTCAKDYYELQDLFYIFGKANLYFRLMEE